MRKYEEMLPEFASFSLAEKVKWLHGLTIEELREFKRGINNTHYWNGAYWETNIDDVISQKINEMREGKLNDLGL